MQISLSQIQNVIDTYWSEKGLLARLSNQPTSLIKILNDFVQGLEPHPKNESLIIAAQFRLCKILLEFYLANIDSFGYLVTDNETSRAFHSLVDLVGRDFFHGLRALERDGIFNTFSFLMVCTWPSKNLTKNISKELYQVVVLLTSSDLINDEIRTWLATLDYSEIRLLNEILTTLDNAKLLNVAVFPIFDKYKLSGPGELTSENNFHYISKILVSFEAKEYRTLFSGLVARIQSPAMDESFDLYRRQIVKCLPLFPKSQIAGAGPLQVGHVGAHTSLVEFLTQFLCKLIRDGFLTVERFQFILLHPEIMVKLSYYFAYAGKTSNPNCTKLFDLILHFAKRLLIFRADALHSTLLFINKVLNDTIIEKLIAYPNPDGIYKALSLLASITPNVTPKMLNAILNESPHWTASIMKKLASRKMLTDLNIDFLATLNTNQITRLYGYIKPSVTAQDIALFLKNLEKEQLVEANRFLKPLQQDRQGYFSLLPSSLLFFNRTERCIFHTTDEINKILEQKPPRGRSLSF